IFINPGGTTAPAALAPYLNNVRVSILDPNGNVLASATSASSGSVVTLAGIGLPADGTYSVIVQASSSQPSSTGHYMIAVFDATGGQAGSYSFRIDLTSQTVLTPGTTYTGTVQGSGHPQLFRVDVSAPKSLLIVLHDGSSADDNELYLKYGAPPTRSDYQYRS